MKHDCPKLLLRRCFLCLRMQNCSTEAMLPATRREAHMKLDDFADLRLPIMCDFAGTEAPLYALSELGLSYRHVGSCDISPGPHKFILRNHAPEQFWADVMSRPDDELAATRVGPLPEQLPFATFLQPCLNLLASSRHPACIRRCLTCEVSTSEASRARRSASSQRRQTCCVISEHVLSTGCCTH